MSSGNNNNKNKKPPATAHRTAAQKMKVAEPGVTLQQQQKQHKLIALPTVTTLGGILGDDPPITSFDQLYETDQRLRSGSFGVVHTCHHKLHPDTTYAVKILDRTKLKPKDDDAVFREVKILQELAQEPHVVHLIDFFVETDRLCVVQEFAAGGDVFDRLCQRLKYTEADARQLARYLLQAVAALHGVKPYPIVHRDLKPENLLLKTAMDDAGILVADFGFARHVKEDLCQTRCGTPGMMCFFVFFGVVGHEQTEVYECEWVVEFKVCHHYIWSESLSQNTILLLLKIIPQPTSLPKLLSESVTLHLAICGALVVCYTCSFVATPPSRVPITANSFAKSGLAILPFTTHTGATCRWQPSDSLVVCCVSIRHCVGMRRRPCSATGLPRPTRRPCVPRI